jgi:hypothetical protein
MGLYIHPLAGTFVNKYGIYQAGSGDINYYAGINNFDQSLNLSSIYPIIATSASLNVILMKSLDGAGGGSAIYFQSHDGLTTNFAFGDGRAIVGGTVPDPMFYAPGSYDFRFYIGGADRGRIKTGGNWLIGTAVDDGVNKLQVNGTMSIQGTGTSSVAGGLHIGGTSAVSAGNLLVDSTITSSGIKLTKIDTLTGASLDVLLRNSTLIGHDGSGDPIVVTLPPANSCQGKIYIFKYIDDSGQYYEFDGYDTEQIDGSNSITMTLLNESYTIQSTGNQWIIISHYVP